MFYGQIIRQLHCTVGQALDAALSGMELTASQGHALGYITHAAAPPCPKDIEEAFQLSHPTVSGILARLEKKEFIELVSDPKDRRYKRIYVLPKGVAYKETMHNILDGIELQIVDGFSPEEKVQFSRFLCRALHNLGGNPCEGIIKEENNK